MKKEMAKVGLKKTKNFQSYESSIEKEIFYNNAEERQNIVSELFAQCRKSISEQMKVDGNKQ